MSLYDENQQYITAVNGNYGTNVSLLKLIPTCGTYYLKVEDYGNNASNAQLYNLNLSVDTMVVQNNYTYVTATTCNPANVGVVSQSYPSYNGCDSVVVTTTIGSPVHNISISENTCDPNQVGTITQVLVNQFGCDSTVNTTYSLYSTSENITTSICQGQSYTVGNSTYTTSGTYTDVLQTWQGCDSTVTLNLTIEPEITIIDTIITDGVDVPLGSIDITPSGNSTNYQYHWSTGATTQDVTDLGTGFYSLTITNAHGCTDTFSFEIGTVNTFFVADKQEINVQLYPNPIKENELITLEFSDSFSEDLKYQILSLDGKTVQTGKLTKNQLKHQVKLQQSVIEGTYYFILFSNNQRIKVIPFSAY